MKGSISNLTLIVHPNDDLMIKLYKADRSSDSREKKKKLYKSRSLLYRRQILQENFRWKALDEIYKIYMLLHRSDLHISENFRQTFSHFLNLFLAKFKFAKFTHFRKMFIDFCSEFDELLSEFRRYFRKC